MLLFSCLLCSCFVLNCCWPHFCMRIFEAKLALSQAKSYPSRAAVTGRTYLSGPTVAELVKEGPFKAVFDDTAGKCQHCQA